MQRIWGQSICQELTASSATDERACGVVPPLSFCGWGRWTFTRLPAARSRSAPGRAARVAATWRGRPDLAGVRVGARKASATRARAANSTMRSEIAMSGLVRERNGGARWWSTQGSIGGSAPTRTKVQLERCGKEAANAFLVFLREEKSLVRRLELNAERIERRRNLRFSKATHCNRAACKNTPTARGGKA